MFPASAHSTCVRPGSFGACAETVYLCLQRMDPQLRKLLECAYEAWLDSGIDHRALRGSSKVALPPDSPLHPAILSCTWNPSLRCTSSE